jgi:hypothetical protein
MWKYLIWVVWLVLVVIWLSPEVESVRDKVKEHNAQIERALQE